MSFLDGATSFDLFLQASKVKETEGLISYELFVSPENLNSQDCPSYSNALEKAYADFENLFKSDLSTKLKLSEIKTKNISPSDTQNYLYLFSIWAIEQRQSFWNFLKWYFNTEFVPTLYSMLKILEIYHDKGIDTLMLVGTFPNSTNICWHKATNFKYFPFTGTDTYFLQKYGKIWFVDFP